MHQFSMTVAALLLLVVFCGTSRAQNCYSRNSATTSSNGNSDPCASGTDCYSYSTSSGSKAGCGNCTSASVSSRYQPGCVDCNTNNCNTQPSIVCNSYSSSGVTSKTCYGFRQCYNYTASGKTIGGCGGCHLITTSGTGICSNCSMARCNPIPSTRCHSRLFSYSYSDSSRISCPGYDSCYNAVNSILFVNIFVSGCGDCNAISSALGSCKHCSGDYCNAAAFAGGSWLLMLLAAAAAAAAAKWRVD